MVMNLENIYRCFPKHLKILLEGNILQNQMEMLEEIRIRNGLPIILKLGQAEKIIYYKTSTEDINFIFQKICDNSIYTYQNQIANGFITIQGGNRVGIVGTAVVQDGKVTNFNYISSLNFRIGRQIIGCSNQVVDKIVDFTNNRVFNTLIISMPGFGKTTILRDIIRNISNGFEIETVRKFNGVNVAVIDERGEISATYRGVTQNDLGIRTDVINDIPKAIGMRMAIRSMAPQVIVADEIGSNEDCDCIEYALHCGVNGIFTAHGKDLEDIKNNAELRNLLDKKVFEKAIIIHQNRKYEVINVGRL